MDNTTVFGAGLWTLLLRAIVTGMASALLLALCVLALAAVAPATTAPLPPDPLCPSVALAATGGQRP